MKEVKQLQQSIESDFGIFTTVRKGLSSGACVRVTPQVFNTPEEINKLVYALQEINRLNNARNSALNGNNS